MFGEVKRGAACAFGSSPLSAWCWMRIPRNQGTGLATGRRQWTAVARGWYGCLHHSAPNRQDAERPLAATGLRDHYPVHRPAEHRNVCGGAHDLRVDRLEENEFARRHSRACLPASKASGTRCSPYRPHVSGIWSRHPARTCDRAGAAHAPGEWSSGSAAGPRLSTTGIRLSATDS